MNVLRIDSRLQMSYPMIRNYLNIPGRDYDFIINIKKLSPTEGVGGRRHDRELFKNCMEKFI
jgi:hypothetical protein